jgi:hypothetical protein
MGAPFLEIVGVHSREALLVGYPGEALEELFRGTLESCIKPTLCLNKSTAT